MKLSLIVPTHGRRDLLTRTLKSLDRQVQAPDFEVVVIDDGADPGLTDYVAGLELRCVTRVVHHEVNQGRSAARNTGIQNAQGDVVVFLDGDMEVEPEFVRAHADLHGPARRVVLGNIRTSPDVRARSFVEYIDSRGVKKVEGSGPIPHRYFMTGNSSVARALLAEAGSFDEDFNQYGGEDTEMGYRLAEKGGDFRYAERAVSWHLSLNTVPEMAERLRRYGEHMLPVLVEKVPRAHTELRLDLTDPIRWTQDSPRRLFQKLIVRLVAHRTVWAPLARLGEWIPRGIPAPWLFDLVRAASYLEGYAASRRRDP